MNNIEMKNRWIALYVENEVGVLAKVSGLFSAKSYNLQSLTVIDLTDVPLHMKEILYVRVSKLTREEITDIFQTAQVFNIDVVDKNADSVILESKLTEHRNDDLIAPVSYTHLTLPTSDLV